MSAISVKNLTFEVNNHKILDNLSFEVKKGDVVAIVGPNGSGKTTLIKALLGLKKYEGTALILDEPAHHINEIAHKIGYVPQALDFDRSMPITVSELINIFDRDPNGNKDYASQINRTLGVTPLLTKKLGVLSGGEFQRVLLALALQNKPEILFLDEPTSGVDVEGAGEIYEIIQELRKSDEITIMMISHDLDVVYKYADKVICLNHKLICEGVPSEAITQETLDVLYGKHRSVFKHDKPKGTEHNSQDHA